MSTIQNLKNFIRHGKQARQPNSPHAEATTNVSNVHAQQQRHHHHQPPLDNSVTDPNFADHRAPPHIPGGAAGGFSTSPNNRNQAARAGDAAAKAAEGNQKLHQQPHARDAAADRKQKEIDPSVLERIVAEERESKGKMPKYPGLERWQLEEKMGDGAFSNVYRARDLQGQYPQVAIKVVRKYEMNNSQVRHLF